MIATTLVIHAGIAERRRGAALDGAMAGAAGLQVLHAHTQYFVREQDWCARACVCAGLL